MKFMKEAEILKTVKNVMTMESQAIENCTKRLVENPQNIIQAILLMDEALNEGKKIIVTGVGKSGKIAQKIAATLTSTGSLAIYLHPTEAVHGDLGVVEQGDVILALSYTGNTEEILQLVPMLRRRDAKVIGMGGNALSQFAQVCDVWIDAAVSAEACLHNLAPTSSTTLALALGDAIAVALMQRRGFAVEAFAVNHPGGSLGRKISLSVRDLMVSGDLVPRVALSAPVEDVLVASSEKKLGAVLVIEENKLLGIITDGDIRRALSRKNEFFKLCARDLMTTQPVVATPDMKALEALGLMESRPSQISVLPVVDTDKRCLGLIRLHDLVQAF
jgi:arabinose-5-phosphate isomerase